MKSKHGREDPERDAEKRKYPIGAEHYTLYEEVGQGVSASVHRALCDSFNEVVAIKILDFERDNCDLNNVCREAQTMILVNHPNVLRAHCSFVNDHTLWVVMPYMSGGSCLHILKAAYPDGFEEVVIATILKEALKGLEYLHQHGHIHRDIKAGNVLLDSRGAVKLGDFGVSACLFDSGDRQRTRNTFVGTPCWMAPEVLEQLHGYDFKADIWSFGITALELAHGHAPFSKYPPMKVLLMTLQSAPPGLDYERDKKFSKSFKQMIASCLVKDPTKRPTAKKLLKHSFFKQARSNDYISRTLLDGLPALGDRIQALKRKEEDMVQQKKMPDGEKEEISQNEYKRGISGWNFNLDNMKAQASLIQDIDDTPSMSDGFGDGSTSSSSTIDAHARYLPPHMSNIAEYSDMEDKESDAGQNQSISIPMVDSIASSIMRRAEKSEDELSIASSSNEMHADQIDNKSEGLDGIPGSNSNQKKGGSSSGINILDFPSRLTRVESGKMLILPHINSNGNLSTTSSTEDMLSELPPRVGKSSVNSDELDEKVKGPVVQQRGRFKVTSENVDLEKVVPPPVLHRSHSMQVITPHQALTASPLPSPSPISHGNSLLPTLYSFLQTNIQQRESILTLLKQAAAGDLTAYRPTDVGATPAYSEKSLRYALRKLVHPKLTRPSIGWKYKLEAAHEREMELLHEITELQWRLLSSQDELKKLKSDNPCQENPRQLLP